MSRRGKEYPTNNSYAREHKPKNVISRRAFLAGLGAGTALGALAITEIPKSPLYKAVFNSGKDEQTSSPEFTDTLKKLVENEFNIELHTYHDFPQAGLSEEYLKQVPEKWDEAQIKLLAKFLYLVPPHFYNKNFEKSNNKLKFVLDKVNDERQLERASCCFLQEGQTYHEPVIKLPGDLFKQFEDKAFSTLVHEMVHFVNPSDNYLINGSDQQKAKALEEEQRKFWLEINTTLGMNPSEEMNPYQRRTYELNYFTPMSTKALNKMAQVKYNSEEYYMYQTLAYGFNNLDEFVAVMGENYIHGREYFGKAYSAVFSEPVIDRLYNMTKDDIYKGKEYQEFPIKVQK